MQSGNPGDECDDTIFNENISIMKQNKQRARRLQLCVATVTVVAGMALITTGFFVPPLGVIDASVLTAFGEILTFAGALFGMDYHYKQKNNGSENETT